MAVRKTYYSTPFRWFCSFVSEYIMCFYCLNICHHKQAKQTTKTHTNKTQSTELLYKLAAAAYDDVYLYVWVQYVSVPAMSGLTTDNNRWYAQRAKMTQSTLHLLSACLARLWLCITVCFTYTTKHFKSERVRVRVTRSVN